MKIVIDCRYLGESGIGTYVENIVDELIDNHPENNYLLITLKDSYYTNRKNVAILKTGIKPFSIKEYTFFPTKRINTYDVYFTPYFNIPSGIKIPVFPTIHDAIFWDLPELSTSCGRFIRSLFVKRAIRKAIAIFTVSQFSKERIKFHFNVPKKIYIIHNSIAKSLREYQPQSPKKEDTIVYVGNIKAHKGLKVLLEAFFKAKKEGSQSKLILVGKGDKFRTSDQETMDLLNKAPEDIVFTGYLPSEEMYETINRARLLILPSKYEGFGIPPMEALYLGTNAILSDIPALKEIYANLPVTFFMSEDTDDLKEKIMASYDSIDMKSVREQIVSQYSIHHQVNYLLEVIKQNS